VAGRGFSGTIRPNLGIPGIVNVPGTKTSSVLDTYGDRSLAEDIVNQASNQQVVTDSGVSRTVIGPYQLPNDTSKSWFLDVWDGDSRKYRTILLPSDKLFDVTNYSPSNGGGSSGSVEYTRDEYVVTDKTRLIYATSYSILTNSEVVTVNGLVQLPGLTRQYIIQGQSVRFISDVDLYVGDIIHIQYAKA
jgi:hypothetical protein